MPRRLGQHFLASTSALERIASAAVPDPSGTVVEIGPGKGALTQHLLARAARVVAIEVDGILVHYLREKFRGNDRFTVLHSDVLKTDLAQWGPVRVAGNLPYYITSPILERVLRLGPALLGAVFLVQKEVAERIAASPGSRDYGYLSVQCQTLARPEYLFTVPQGAFRPPPKVDSAVVRLAPREEPVVQDVDAFLQFASICFQQKRKTLRNNLAGTYSRELIDAQPEARLRAEQLSVEQLADLYRRLKGTY
jgi:16S rRNA (adenine1518-N6/adenine1519-N6)-dimethyltransferase